MTRFDSCAAVFVITLFVITGYVAWKLSHTPTGRVCLGIYGLSFGVQVSILFVLFLVEYDKFGILPTDFWTMLRILCWLGSLFVPFGLLFYKLYRAPVLIRLPRCELRAFAFGVISLPLAFFGLATGHILFCSTGYGLLFD